LTWSHAYKWNNIQFSLGWKFRTGVPFTKASGIIDNGQGFNIIYENVNAESLPSYHRLDASVVYSFNWSKTSRTKSKLGLSLLNLYDRRNILNRSFSLFEFVTEDGNVNTELQSIDRLSLGFTPNVFFRVVF